MATQSPKKIVDEAVLVLAVMASTPGVQYFSDAHHDLGVYGDSMLLAYNAYEYVFETLCLMKFSPKAPEALAEAEALLRTGWRPL